MIFLAKKSYPKSHMKIQRQQHRRLWNNKCFTLTIQNYIKVNIVTQNSL